MTAPAPRLRLHRTYLFVTVGLLAIEVLIALFVRDAFVRPYVGDVLVVALIYCFARTFVEVAPLPLAAATVAFAMGVEVLQALDFVDRLGLTDVPGARVVLGTSFSWLDLLAYAAGGAAVLAVERALGPRRS